MNTTTNPSTLPVVQRRVQMFLQQPDKPDDMLSSVRGSQRISPQTRLDIYADAYRARLIAALATDYAALQSYLGDDAFTALAQTYIERFPSRHFSLRWFGAAMHEFVATTEPYSDHAEIADLVQFEWAQCHAFDAADAAPLNISDLASVAPEGWAGLQLSLQPALQLLNLTTNAPTIWAALNAEQAPPALEKTNEPATWLIWRQDLRILYRELTPAEACGLRQFQQGKGFADVCAELAEFMPDEEVPAYAAGLLRRWLEAGLIVGLQPSSEAHVD